MNVQPDLAVQIASVHGRELRAFAALQHAGRLARLARRSGFSSNRNGYQPRHGNFEPAGPTLAPAV
jgi:hypothetical protein